MNGKFVDKSNGELITNMIMVCTNMIQIGKSINDNILQVFIHKPFDNYCSVNM